MAKKIYIVFGVEVHKVQEVTYPFCKVFKSEKKADNYYDRKYYELMEKFNDKTVDMYSIDYKEKKIK